MIYFKPCGCKYKRIHRSSSTKVIKYLCRQHSDNIRKKVFKMIDGVIE